MQLQSGTPVDAEAGVKAAPALRPGRPRDLAERGPRRRPGQSAARGPGVPGRVAGRRQLAAWSRPQGARPLTPVGDTHYVTGDLEAPRDAWHEALGILDRLGVVLRVRPDAGFPGADELHAKLRLLDSSTQQPSKR